ncbi:MAG TPA: hypothetical protein PLQ93_11185 [Bacteroidia bacterium]|nr:hypothetical protein [Bacteroidia bacterium]
MLRYLFSIVFFLGSFHFAWSQTGSKPKTIGNNHTQNLVTTLKHDTCLNRKFSIVFYVVLDSSYSPGLATPFNINKMMDTLNDRFKRICVTFANCSTVYIPNYTYNQWVRPVIDTVVTGQWYTSKTINIYIVDSIKQNFPDEPAGYTYGPPSNPAGPSKDVIVLEKWQLLINSSIVPLHQMGHFFGLVHTSSEINPGSPAVPPPPPTVISHEFVNASNCNLHGDGICDTEADPGGALVNADGNGDKYLRPYDNYMSLYSSSCRFSTQQYRRMAYIIITKRKYLH